MKKMCFAFVILLSITAAAQTKKEIKLSEGYWVIENNVKNQKESTVYFYNNNQVLIYKESISGRKLNVNRKKVIRQLNQVLSQSLTAWEKDQVSRQNLNLVWNRR